VPTIVRHIWSFVDARAKGTEERGTEKGRRRLRNPFSTDSNEDGLVDGEDGCDGSVVDDPPPKKKRSRFSCAKKNWLVVGVSSSHSLFHGLKWVNIVTTTVEMFQFFGILLRISMEERDGGG
jgi:hypothetical protein